MLAVLWTFSVLQTLAGLVLLGTAHGIGDIVAGAAFLIVSGVFFSSGAIIREMRKPQEALDTSIPDVKLFERN